jgi:uroporphyrin-3 C-methyltransferase
VQLSAQLAALQAEIPGLPFRGEMETPAAPELTGSSGWWASFKQTLASLVTVRRRAPEEPSLLSLDDMDYLRQGLWLQLESARLALMRNETSVYTGSLDRVNDTLGQFFKTDSFEVQSLISEIEVLRTVNVTPEMPDISAPWTHLRQLRDSRRLLQTAAPVEGEDSGE